ncbi:MAG: T9SS type A sorting domain-containing protein [Bacteroidetes bacterium]|nr:T9SS type A sorting domain-containing protein [Bacteroidota bacterium]
MRKLYFLALALLLISLNSFSQTIVNEAFNSGIPGTWTIVNGGGPVDTWFGTTNGYNGNTLNGTQFAFVNSDAAGNNPHPLLSEQLITPTFNGNAYSTIFLEFDQYYHVYSTDRGYVEVWNGTSWIVLNTLSANTGAWNAPNHATYNLTAYRNAAMKVRFRYEDNNVWAWWWAVDNVEIYAPPANDAHLTTVAIPTSQCAYSANEAITITGINDGTQPITSLPVRYRINGGATVNETYASTIAPGATFNYTFTTPANLSAAGVYVIDVWTSLAGDAILTNDSIVGTTTKNHISVSAFPYTEDFETNTGGWFVTGILPSWAWGTPAKTVIQGASSGQKAWVTGGLGAGDHGNNERNQVEGPCLDFSNTPGPWIGLDAWWNAEFSWDGANLQTSIDSGQTWQNVGQFGDPYNWYTDNSIDGLPGGTNQGWSGRNSSNNGSGGYVRSVHSLANLAGEPAVLLRVAFGSDGSVVDDGFAFDNLTVARQPVLYLGPDTTVCDSVTLDGGNGSAWVWSTGDSTQFVSVDTTGNYTATMFDQYGFPTQDVIHVTVEGPRTWDLGNDSSFCIANSATLLAGAGAQGYLWSDGSTSQQLTATASGTYSVTATSAAGCMRSDTIQLAFSDLSAGIDMLATTICRGVPFPFQDFSTGNPTSWLWDFGNGNLSVNQNPTTVYMAGGTFVVNLEVSDGLCVDDTSVTVLVEVCTGIENDATSGPNAYPIPANDWLFLDGLENIQEDLKLTIFDLSGRIIETFTVQEGNAQKIHIEVKAWPDGVYFAHLKGNNMDWKQKFMVRH